MTTSFLLILASSLPGIAAEEGVSPFEHALTSQSAWVVRAQSPTADSGTSTFTVPPPQGVTSYYPPAGAATIGDPFSNAAQNPYTPGAADPWAGGAIPQTPYIVPGNNQGFYTYGCTGAKPIRTGWQGNAAVSYLPSSGTSPDVGDFTVFGVDLEHKYVDIGPAGWVWTKGVQFNYRGWQGPDGSPATDMPGSAYRLALDLRLQSPSFGRWTFEGAFNPAISSDLRSEPTSAAWMFDGHLVGFWQWTPTFSVAIGALYWDRVDDIILPYGGVVWRPNDIWEFQLIFPKPRASVFLGTPWGIPTWLYVSGEYHVEGYQIKPKQFANSTEVQIKDWRVMGGLQWETGRSTSFAEAGVVLDRQVEYAGGFTGFDPDTGFIGRIGVSY